MKVLLVNGSPHKDGCTYTALCEVSEALNEQGIDTDIFWIGKKPLSGCIACKSCMKNNKCVFHDSVNEFLEIMKDLYLGHLYTGEGPVAVLLRFWTEFFMLISMEEEIVFC